MLSTPRQFTVVSVWRVCRPEMRTFSPASSALYAERSNNLVKNHVSGLLIKVEAKVNVKQSRRSSKGGRITIRGNIPLNLQ